MVAMVPCDTVAQDMIYERLILAGTRSNWVMGRFPAAMPPFCIYLAFTELRGSVTLEIHLLDSTLALMKATEPIAVVCDDETLIVEAIAMFTNVRIPQAVHYFLRLFADKVYIMDMRVMIRQKENSGG
jgi:hypothetical protein